MEGRLDAWFFGVFGVFGVFGGFAGFVWGFCLGVLFGGFGALFWVLGLGVLGFCVCVFFFFFWGGGCFFWFLVVVCVFWRLFGFMMVLASGLLELLTGKSRSKISHVFK